VTVGYTDSRSAAQTVTSATTAAVANANEAPEISQGAGPLAFTVAEDSGLVSLLNWDKRFGGSGYDKIDSVVATSDGGYLLAGRSISDPDGDKSEGTRGGYDYWAVKINAFGAKLWDKRFGGSGIDYCQSVIETSDGGYLLAGYSSSPADGDKSEASRGSSDYWAVKINASGTKLWDKRFGGSGTDECYAVVATSDGGYLLAGLSQSGADGDKSEASRGSGDYWVVKINGSGTKIWDKRFGGSGYDELVNVITTPDGGYLLAGWTYS